MARTPVLLAATLALAAASAPSSAGAETDAANVAIGDSYYEPETLTVFPGETVTWTHQGNLPHSVTADDGAFDSSPACGASTTPCMQSGSTFTRQFPALGTFRYHCKLHGSPGGGGMSGVIEVVDPQLRPTTVDSLTAAASGGALQVSGRATFGGQTPVLVGEDGAGDPPIRPELAALGLDATTISVHQPDPSTPEVVFVIKVTQMDREPPPEVVRYLWEFKVGTKEYWVQAKTSDLTSVLLLPDDPPGAATHIPGSFRLRGDCATTTVGPASLTNCKHLAWISGAFDADKDEVRIRLPLDLAAAPDIRPGAIIGIDEGVGAGLQAAFSNATTTDRVAQDQDYAIPTKEVRMGIAPAGTAPGSVVFATPAALAPDGAFTGTLDTSGLAPGTYDVWTRACFGANCGLRSVTVTI